MDFLPQWPPDINLFILFGVILLLGLVGGSWRGAQAFCPALAASFSSAW